MESSASFTHVPSQRVLEITNQFLLLFIGNLLQLNDVCRLRLLDSVTYKLELQQRVTTIEIAELINTDNIRPLGLRSAPTYDSTPSTPHSILIAPISASLICLHLSTLLNLYFQSIGNGKPSKVHISFSTSWV